MTPLCTPRCTQSEVERYFVDQGFLFPEYHDNYWLGAEASPWPEFVWLESTNPAPGPDTYTNWGTYTDSKGRTSNEPNNKLGAEFCAVANFTETSGGPWSWADTNCLDGQKWPFICMVKRGWRLRSAALAAAECCHLASHACQWLAVLLANKSHTTLTQHKLR